jgi:hydrogenase 3 maturation protease
VQTLKTTLLHRLAGAKRVAVLGIGSDLRADDAAGNIAAVRLMKALARRKKKAPAKVFLGETAPENLTGEIKRYKPSHLVIVDTADLRKKPGSIFIFKPEALGEGVSFSTHKMPARILVDYLVTSLGCDVTIIGIQPGSVAFGKAPSKTVTDAAKRTALALAGAIR